MRIQPQFLNFFFSFVSQTFNFQGADLSQREREGDTAKEKDLESESASEGACWSVNV